MIDREIFTKSDEIAEQVLQLIKERTQTEEWYTSTMAQINELLPECTKGQIRHALKKLQDRKLIISQQRSLQYMNPICSYKPL